MLEAFLIWEYARLSKGGASRLSDGIINIPCELKASRMEILGSFGPEETNPSNVLENSLNQLAAA